MQAVDLSPHRIVTMQLRVPLDLPLAADEVQEGFAALLFHDGKISHKEACDLIGADRCAFDTILAHHGFSPVDGVNPDEEIAAAKAW